MHEFFLGQMDYIYFVYGLSFLILGANCVSLQRRLKDPLWLWLGLFGLLHGIVEWLDLASISLVAAHWFSILKVFFLVASFLCFFEYARSRLVLRFPAIFSVWFYLPFIVMFAWAWKIDSTVGLGAMARYFFGTIGGITMAVIVWKLSAKNEDRGLCRSQRILAVLIGLYAFTQLIHAKAKVFIFPSLSQEDFFSVAGFPIQLVRAGLAFLAAFFVWKQKEILSRRSLSEYIKSFHSRYEHMLFISFVLVLILGWMATDFAGNMLKNDQERQLKNISEIAAAAVNPRRIDAFKDSLKEVRGPDYERLREQQVLLRQRMDDTDILWFYLMVEREGKVFFLADSISEGQYPHVPPGTLYESAPKRLSEVFFSRERGIVMAYTDAYGTFLSSFSPIFSVADGAVVAVQGVDIDYKLFIRKIQRARLVVIAWCVIVEILLTIVFIARVRGREYEEKLRESEAHWNSLVRQIPAVIALVERDGKVVHINKGWAGFDADKIIGSNMGDFFDGYEKLRFQSAVERVCDKGEAVNYESRSVGVDQKDIWHENYLGSVEKGGRTGRVIWMAFDISERKKIEDDLHTNQQQLIEAFGRVQKANAELEKTQQQLVQQEKLVAIGFLAAGVAHEINNPLGFIQGNLSALEDYVEALMELLRLAEALKAEIDERSSVVMKDIKRQMDEREAAVELDFILEDIANLLKETQQGVDRIKNIVSDLSRFSRADKGEMAQVDLNNVIDGVISIVWGELKYKVELVKEYGEIPKVYGNAQQLGQVFLNILVNAGQAMVERGKVTIKTGVKGGQALVEIADTGAGISPEDLSKIFDPFFTTKDPGKGTGLGLSISYDIIKKHGGLIDVKSQLGAGTVFTIYLPLKVG